MKRAALRILTLILLPILFWMGMQSKVNFHYHKLADGTIVCHSHPFQHQDKSSPYESHHHNNQELLFILQINLVILFFGLGLALLVFACTYKWLTQPGLFLPVILGYRKLASRAPPFLMV